MAELDIEETTNNFSKIRVLRLQTWGLIILKK